MNIETLERANNIHANIKNVQTELRRIKCSEEHTCRFSDDEGDYRVALSDQEKCIIIAILKANRIMELEKLNQELIKL